ncbi:MAG: hypothetical protein ABIH82_05265 [Candidatus Woesearchaeota archaeon]
MYNQKINNNFNKQIAECVGLWLAEGDNKCNNEITFTNNEFSLIKFFHGNIKHLFSDYQFKIRIYVYTPNWENINVPIKVDKINIYRDVRATKPYYIWRLASVSLNGEWRHIVNQYKDNQRYYPDILRGFFAGEGSIKSGSHSNRIIRISQKKSYFLESMLKYFKVNFRHIEEKRTYEISSKFNWDKLANIKLANLHPTKKEKFWRVYNEFKEEHYKTNYLENIIFKLLLRPYQTSELATKFNRSKARIQDVLIDLKKEGKINNFRVRSASYWIRNDQNIIIISKLKKKYLDFLAKSYKTTKEIANYFKVNNKSSFRRLKELEKLSLVQRNKDKTWKIIEVTKEVLTI